MIELRPEFRFPSQIWSILPGLGPFLPGFGPFWQDLGHFAWIWAIQFGFGPQRRQSPEGGAEGGTDVRTYGQTDSPCVLQDFVPFGAAAQTATSTVTDEVNLPKREVHLLIVTPERDKAYCR